VVTVPGSVVQAPVGSLLYLSQLLGCDLRDQRGEKVATLRDLVVRLDPAEPYDRVIGIVAGIRRQPSYIPWDHVGSVGERDIILKSTKLDLRPFERRDGEMLLGRDVLDKQLVDIEGRRVVRVNDLQLANADGGLRVVGVCVGGRALIRRLLGRYPRTYVPNERVISWQDVEGFAVRNPRVRLKVSYERLAQLHPVEIAHIVDSLSVRQGAELVAALDDEVAADTLEELSEERQAEILEGLDEERAADILEWMGPDEAADALAELPEDKAESILKRMEVEEADDVRELMAYEEDTAGGIMTTEYVVMPVGLSVGEAMTRLRALDWKPEFLHYVYVVDDEQHERLLGVISLSDLILASPDAPLRDVMDADFKWAKPSDGAVDVARLMGEYNLVALPVLTEEGCLQGIVTIDDAMEWVLPEPWRRRLPRFFG
jgi:CBS domain-containing protein/sporulation protein YlmC with PRC-barrel domain